MKYLYVFFPPHNRVNTDVDSAQRQCTQYSSTAYTLVTHIYKIWANRSLSLTLSILGAGASIFGVFFRILLSSSCTSSSCVRGPMALFIPLHGLCLGTITWSYLHLLAQDTWILHRCHGIWHLHLQSLALILLLQLLHLLLRSRSCLLIDIVLLTTCALQFEHAKQIG